MYGTYCLFIIFRNYNFKLTTVVQYEINVRCFFYYYYIIYNFFFKNILLSTIKSVFKNETRIKIYFNKKMCFCFITIFF